jgi:hypothetical protein
MYKHCIFLNNVHVFTRVCLLPLELNTIIIAYHRTFLSVLNLYKFWTKVPLSYFVNLKLEHYFHQRVRSSRLLVFKMLNGF